MWKKMSSPDPSENPTPKPESSRPAASAAQSKFEEQLEFSNVTAFRESLLNFIPRLQENEYLRFVVTKHGEPVAVLLSYRGYALLKRVAERVMDQEDARDTHDDDLKLKTHGVGEEAILEAAAAVPANAGEEIDFSAPRDFSKEETDRMLNLVQKAVSAYIRANRKKAEAEAKLAETQEDETTQAG